MSDILSLLTPPRARSRGAARRPLVVSSVLGACGAAAAVMLPLMALGLVGWFAAGAVGETTGGLRVGADAWLMGHGSRLALGDATITAIPLGITLVSLHLCYRTGRWAATTSDVEDLGTLLIGIAAYAGALGIIGVLTAVLASVPAAQPGLGRSFVGAFLVGLLGGGAGLVAGSDYGIDHVERLPEWAQAAGLGAAATVTGLLAVSSVLVTVSLALHAGAATTVLSRLHVDATGAFLYTVVTAALAPNIVLFGAAYLLGPGFAVGTGTVVSSTDVLLGPVPAFPMLAALPAGGTPPWWASLLVLLPVAVAAVATAWISRRFPATGLVQAAARGVGTGVLAAGLLAVAVSAAGGAIGPGRMQDVGVGLGPALLAGLVTVGAGALIGSVGAHWRSRRHYDG